MWLDSEINKRRGAKGERERRKEARREARSRRKKAAPPPPNLALHCVVRVDYENRIVNRSGRGHSTISLRNRPPPSISLAFIQRHPNRSFWPIVILSLRSTQRTERFDAHVPPSFVRPPNDGKLKYHPHGITSDNKIKRPSPGVPSPVRPTSVHLT